MAAFQSGIVFSGGTARAVPYIPGSDVVGHRFSGAISGMFHSGDAVDRLDELAPGAALRREHVRAGRRQPVVPAPALARFFNPPALNPSPLFQPVQQRVERGDAERKDAARPRLDEL